MVKVPYVPETEVADPLVYVTSETEVAEPAPLCWIAVIVAVELASASVSLSVISPVLLPVLVPETAEPLFATVKVPPSFI